MDKIVHAILISPIAKSIQVVRIDPNDNLASAYKHLGCEMIEAATRLPNGDVVYVDEEGAIIPKGNGHFMFQGNVFQGRGLIVNESGEDWTAPHSPIIKLLRAIEFPPHVKSEPNFGPDDILLAMTQGKFKPMGKHDYEGFAGAKEGSVICYDMFQWTVIVGPGDKGDLDKEALSCHAYLFPSVEASGPQDEAAYELTIDGWQEL